MGNHNAQGSDVEEIEYAEEFVIDEGGIDLKCDGVSVMSASFDHVDNYQLAYEVLPESFIFPASWNAKDVEDWEIVLTEAAKQTGVPSDLSDEDLELTARLFLTALARRKGYEKQ